jgi:haloalkane dehalogenase
MFFDEHMEQTHIDIGSSKLGYRKVGVGPDLLFIHGWPLHRETWRNVAANLGEFTCHLIDLPGSGASVTPSVEKVSLDGHVDAVIQVVDALGLDRFVMVGNNSGGMIARFAAERLGERVTALVLTGTEIPGHHPAQIDRLQLAARLPGSQAVTKALINNRRAARSSNLLGGCFWNRDLIEGDFRTKVLDQTFTDDAVLGRQLEILGSYTTDVVDQLRDTHANLSCPALLIWGEQDPFFPVAKAREMCDQFAGPTEFVALDNARLLVHEEYPIEFARLAAKFLSTVPAV